jgi:hypothetical protein
MKRNTPDTRAEAMGRRAGRDLAALGLPARNPFTVDRLRRAWARGYVAGSQRGGSGSSARDTQRNP